MTGRILVQAEEDRCGNITARPVSDRWARRFCRRVAKNGGASFDVWKREGFSAFFNEGLSASEFIDAICPARKRQDLEQGWTVRFLADPWDVGHWYGYDAHTVCEGK